MFNSIDLKAFRGGSRTTSIFPLGGLYPAKVARYLELH